MIEKKFFTYENITSKKETDAVKRNLFSLGYKILNVSESADEDFGTSSVTVTAERESGISNDLIEIEKEMNSLIKDGEKELYERKMKIETEKSKNFWTLSELLILLSVIFLLTGCSLCLSDSEAKDAVSGAFMIVAGLSLIIFQIVRKVKRVKIFRLDTENNPNKDKIENLIIKAKNLLKTD
jgi:hypothetical protein